MRTLNRNKKKFYYATFVSKAELADEYGNKTGQYTITYSAPVAMYENISAARGTSDVEIFGISVSYDKTIVTNNIACPISETSILWVDKVPETPYVATAPKNDYVVKRVAKSINSITYAIQKVEVS